MFVPLFWVRLCVVPEISPVKAAVRMEIGDPALLENAANVEPNSLLLVQTSLDCWSARLAVGGTDPVRAQQLRWHAAWEREKIK